MIGYRLSGRRAFAAVRRWRVSGSSGPLRIHAGRNPLDRARFGFAVPRAVGGAVVRNRVRRRLRAVLREHLGELAGVDLVVSAAPPAAKRSYAELREDVARCLEQVLPRVRAAAAPPEAENGRTPMQPTPRLCAASTP